MQGRWIDAIVPGVCKGVESMRSTLAFILVVVGWCSRCASTGFTPYPMILAMAANRTVHVGTQIGWCLPPRLPGPGHRKWLIEAGPLHTSVAHVPLVWLSNPNGVGAHSPPAGGRPRRRRPGSVYSSLESPYRVMNGNVEGPGPTSCVRVFAAFTSERTMG